jgi:hypothetical protein
LAVRHKKVLIGWAIIIGAILTPFILISTVDGWDE